MKVILSPDAFADPQEIGDYIGQDSLDAASSFVARLKARCLELGTSRMQDESARKFDKAVAAWSKTTMSSFGLLN